MRLAHRDEKSEEGLFDPSFFVDIAIDRGAHALPDPRHRCHDGGLHRRHVGQHDLPDGLRVGDGGSPGKHEVVDDPLEGVPHREDGQEDVAGPDVNGIRNCPQVVEEVRMRQHDSLRFTRGSRCIDDRREVLGLPLFHFLHECLRIGGELLLSPLHDLREGEQLDTCRRGNRARHEAVVDDDDGLQERKLLLLRQDLLRLLGILRQRQGAVGVLQDVAGFFRHGVGAPGNIGRADAEDRDVGDHPLLAVVRDHSHVVSAFYAEVEEPGAEALDQAGELAIGERSEFSRPVLVLDGRSVRQFFGHRPVDLYDGVFHAFPPAFDCSSSDKDCGKRRVA